MKAITVAGTGEAHCGPGMAHALGLIAMVKAGEIPVACGRETPLVGDHVSPPDWRALVDSDMGIRWPNVGSSSSLSAFELIQATLRTASQPVVMVTDGPLTNVGEALQADPQLAKKIQMIYIMGGAIDVSGNLYGVPLTTPNDTAEFNIFIDPHAANLVLQSGAPITLVPLDVTNQVPLDEIFYKILGQHQYTDAATAVYQMLTSSNFYQWAGVYLWDPLTYAIASDESLATFATKKITVIEKEGPEIGRTKVSDIGTDVRVALTTDVGRFQDTYLSTLNGGQKISIDWAAARATPTPPALVLTVTVSAGKCTLEGPKRVPAGEFGVNLIDNDLDKGAMLAICTLDEGKIIADLNAWPSVDAPPWVQVLGADGTDPGKEVMQTITVNGKPIYLVCFTGWPPTSKIGVLGPIELIK